MEYQEVVNELRNEIPKEEFNRIMSQDYCELDYTFLGFIEVYKSLLNFVPKHYTIVDLGCYIAAQSYYFKEYKKYIGVDICDLNRFTPNNAEHHYCSIQDFIANKFDKLDLDTTFAICSYVSDSNAIKLARETFKNILVYYPARDKSNRIKL